MPEMATAAQFVCDTSLSYHQAQVSLREHAHYLHPADRDHCPVCVRACVRACLCLCACVCMCGVCGVCVRACVRACVCVCHVCVFCIIMNPQHYISQYSEGGSCPPI